MQFLFLIPNKFMLLVKISNLPLSVKYRKSAMIVAVFSDDLKSANSPGEALRTVRTIL